MVRAFYRVAWRRIQLVPDSELLWRALRQRDQVYATGEIKPAFFRDQSGLSCDLARFSTPEASRRGHGKQKYPAEAGLVEFRVVDVRALGSNVRHAPTRDPQINYAHSQFTTFLDKPAAELLIAVASFRIPQRFRV
jgi:hypothetical protein